MLISVSTSLEGGIKGEGGRGGGGQVVLYRKIRKVVGVSDVGVWVLYWFHECMYDTCATAACMIRVPLLREWYVSHCCVSGTCATAA